MKKFITLVLVGALVLGMAVTGVAFANEKPNNGGRHAPPPMMGTVTHKNANQITVSAPGMDFINITITLNDETTFYDGTGEREKGETPPEIAISDIKKGDKIVAHGKVVRDGEDSPATYVAVKVVKVDSFPKPDKGGDKGKEQPPTMNVLFKSSNGSTITVTSPNGEKEFEIALGEEAKVFKLIRNEGEKATKEEIAIGNLNEGDKLVITAFRKKDDDGNVIITAKFILLVDEFPQQRGGDKGDKGREKMHQILGTFAGFDGEFMLIDPIKEDMDQLRIKLSDKTKYVRFEKPTEEGQKPEKIDMEKGDLTAGQKVSVQVIPMKDGEESRTPMAVVVVFIEEFPPARAGGEITAINAKSITIEMKNGESLTLEITDETKFAIHTKGEKKPTEAKKSDFKKGDHVGISFKDGVALLITKRAEK